jgi:signal transduction histidine kinase
MMSASLPLSPPIHPAPPSAPAAAPAGPTLWREALLASQALLALSALILAILWGSIAFQVEREVDETLHNAEVNLTNLARAFAEHSAKTLEGADQAVRFIRNEYLERGKDLNIASYLSDKRIIGPEYHLLSVIGADGYVTHSSQPFQRVDLRDREHFRVHAEGTADRLFISKPVLGRVSRKWSIQLTRRIDGPQHEFGGVVVLSLSPDYLTRFYRDVDLGPHGAITLAGYDGVVRARATQDNAEGSQDISGSPVFKEARLRKTGTMRGVSAIDHIERVWAFRALDDYGLMVFTGAGVDDLMAEPLQRRTAYLLGGGVLSLVIVAFVVGLLNRARVQIRLVRQLEASNEQANAANRMKTRFLASVSHELRTPLNGILGYAELIRDGSTEAESREYGDIIHTSAKHLHGLVNDILDLAKIESGRMEIHRAPTSIAGLLGEVQRLHSAHAQARGLALRVEVDASCPAEFSADRLRLVQVLNNLVNNAVKFTERGEVVVRASAYSGTVTIAVADTGIGIPAEQLPSIFTRFQAVGQDQVQPEQGAGLGLPLSHELTTLMGGTIDVASTPGVGTTVTLALPAADPARTS